MRARRPVAGMVLVGLAAIGGFGGAETTAAPSVTSSVVIYVRDSSRLVLANADGSGERTVLDVDDGPSEMSVSPDGERVAFADLDHVYVLDLATQSVHTVAESRIVVDTPRWSPDGTLIGYERGSAVWVVGADGRGARQVAPPNSTRTDFAWSPDGRRIAAGDGEVLAVFDVATGKRTQIAGGGAWRPAWSPDGKWIAFLADEGGLSLVRPDGTGLRVIGPDNVADTPAWAPDSSRVAYTASAWLPSGLEDQVVVVDPKTGRWRELTTPAAGRAAEPAWSADSRRIAFIRDRAPSGDAGADVWVMNADGRGKRRLTNAFPDGGEAEHVEWVPQRARVAPQASPLRSTPLPTSLTVVVPEAARDLVSDKRLAAAVIGERVLDDGDVRVWAPPQRRLRRISRRCEGGVDSIGIAGTHLSWTCWWTGISEGGRSVQTVDLRRGKPTSVFARGGPGGSISLAAGGDLTAFVWRGLLWRLEGGRARRIGPCNCEDLVGVAGNRIAVVRKGGAVDVLNADGRRQARFALASDSSSMLTPTSLIVERSGSIDVYDIASRRRFVSFPVRAHGWRWSVLAARGRYIAYATGLALHVRDLRSGRESVFRIPGAVGPIRATFSDDGLVVSYARAYSARHGGVAFVPWRQLPPLRAKP